MQDSLDDLIVVGKKEKERKEEVWPYDAELFIDADTLCYSAAAACDGSYWSIWREGGTCWQSPFKYKKEAIAYAVNKNIDSPVYKQDWEPEPTENAIHLLKNSLKIFNNVPATYYLTPSSNFRDVAVDDYKANRVGKRKPEHLKACRKWLLDNENALVCKDIEADDAVIMAYMSYAQAGTPIIVGVDKDLKQIEATFSDFKGNTVWIDRATGRRSLWEQIAVGDTTDNIKTPRGIGPAAFKKAFKDVDWVTTDDYTLLKLMVKLYCTKAKQEEHEDKKVYLTRIVTWIQRTARLVYLLRYEGDQWMIPKNDGGIRW